MDEEYQFQLLDLRIEDWLPKAVSYNSLDELSNENFMNIKHESIYVSEKNICYAILFGRTNDGRSICVRISDFKPSLYFFESDFSSVTDLTDKIVCEVNSKENKSFKYISSFDLDIKQVKKKHSYGFEPNEEGTDRKEFNYYKVTFPTKSSWNAIASKSNNSEISSKAHEKNVDPITRFFIDTNTRPGWFKVYGESVDEKISTCTLEITSSCENVSSFVSKKNAPIRIAYFDIETHGLESDKYPICTIGITVKVYGSNDIKEYGLQVYETEAIEGKKVSSFKDEKSLLNGFREFMMYNDIDCWVSYNGSNFDELFIYERSAITNAEYAYYCSRFIFQKCRKKKIPLSSSGMGDNELEIIETPGVPHFDWFIKFKIEDREPTYKLQHFATKYCGKGKDDMHYSEIPILANGTPKDRARLVKYCIMDCTLLDELEKKRNIFNDLFSLSNVCLILPQWVYFKGQQVRYIAQLTQKAMSKNMILNVPTCGFSGNNSSKYDGAIVFEPIRGYYDEEAVHVVDYKSLYPSIIISHNFCPSTLIQKEEYQNDQDIEKHTISGKDNVTYYFTTKVKGLLPEMLEDLLNARDETKKEMKIAKRNLESSTSEEEKENLISEINNLDGKQKAQKISANSLYGAMGAFSTGTYICLAAAESCTNMARIMLEETRDYLSSNYDCVVVYGDTDSCMVKFNGITDLQESGRIAKEAANGVTEMYKNKGYPKKILEYEDSLFPALFLNKKRYIGFMYVESKDGTLVENGIYCKGVETERRDFCKFSKDVYRKMIDNLIVKKSLEGALSGLDNDMKNLINKNVDFESFVLNKSLSKSYKDPENQPHYQVNEKRKKRNPGSEYSIGERVDYVVVEGLPNSKLAQNAEDPYYVKENKLKIDYQWYCEHQVKEPITRLLEPIEGVPRNLFDRYCGELKRKRLNVSSLLDFGISDKKTDEPLFKMTNNKTLEKNVQKELKPNGKNISFFFQNQNDSQEETITFPKIPSTTEPLTKKRKGSKK
mgnify:CR=1 FL=1|tara:strand:- start:1157 stop:4159 length:3003 start_codon:yes stop_codon:yes gene_type:complete